MTVYLFLLKRRKMSKIKAVLLNNNNKLELVIKLLRGKKNEWNFYEEKSMNLRVYLSCLTLKFNRLIIPVSSV